MKRRDRRRQDDLERRLVWLVGGPRTGSTWLLNLVTYPLTFATTPSGSANRGGTTARPFALPVNEPYLGSHLAPIETIHPVGVFTPAEVREGDPSYFFSPEYAQTWRPLLRQLILERLGAQATLAAAEHGLRAPLVVAKEPNGSHAAPVIAAAVPGSRLLYLRRDPRDVLDSLLDAVSPGSWLAGGLDTDTVTTPAGRLDFLRRHSWLWLHRTTMIERALAAHDSELCMTVRYEDLLDDTHGILTQVVSWLGVSRSADEIDQAVRANAFESYSADAKGSGKAARFAEPGHWRHGLSAGEQEQVNEILGPKLRELSYA